MFNFIWKFALSLVCIVVIVYLLTIMGVVSFIGYLAVTGGI